MAFSKEKFVTLFVGGRMIELDEKWLGKRLTIEDKAAISEEADLRDAYGRPTKWNSTKKALIESGKYEVRDVRVYDPLTQKTARRSIINKR